MNYVIVNEKNRQPPKPSEMLQSLKTKKPVAARDDVISEQSAGQVWETYKALAAGEKPVAPQAPEKPNVPKPRPVKTGTAQPSQAPLPATGIAGLLQQYQKNKEGRSGINTLVVNPRSGE